MHAITTLDFVELDREGAQYTKKTYIGNCHFAKMTNSRCGV